MSAFTCAEVGELREILGQGEEGVVYAYKTYAIKVVKRKTDEEILRIASDADVSARYYGTEKCDGMFYIVHERLPTPFNDAYAYQIPELIVRTIEAGIYHNDFRTNNMMIDSDGQLKFIDFGTSILISLYGSKRFDKLVKNITYQDDATHKEIPVVFTPEQIARIYTMRPTVEKTDHEKHEEEELERTKQKMRNQLRERTQAKLQEIKGKVGGYKSKSRRTRKRKSKR